MVALNISVQSLRDVQEGRGVFPSLSLQEHKQLEPAQSISVAILEAGTVAGNTSLMIMLQAPDGRRYYSEITKALFDGLANAVAGAELRFQDEKAAPTGQK